MTKASPIAAHRAASADAPLRRELYFFTLYRILEAALLTFAAFGPRGELVAFPLPLTLQVIAPVYLAAAVVLFLIGRQPRYGLRLQTAVGLALDLVVGFFALHTIPAFSEGIALLLVLNVGAGALLLPRHASIGFAIAAVVGVFASHLVGAVVGSEVPRSLPESVLISITFVATAALCHLLGRQMREASALAERRGADLASLSQLNDLIIRRMRTGVLVVDEAHQVQMINEAGWFLLGSPSPGERDLRAIAPELSRRLYHWRNDTQTDSSPVALAEDVPDVIPRFARLTASDELFLIFLDDTSLVSRRAEQLTLTSLGRLSASIAHEVRNPLAAISYSAQLLEESPDLSDTDRRLVEIVRNHCERMNGIVENILNLSRRERSRPDTVDLAQWVFEFVEDFKTSRFLDADEVRAVTQSRHLYAVVDPQHLHQVLTNLVNNALAYGRLPGEPARVTIIARQATEASPPLIEVIDRGPGIPPRVVDSIFDPFYTTSEHGTGLGLYLARQLCEANQATLEYVQLPGGGSCFRISLAKPRVIGQIAGDRAVAAG